MPSVASKRRAFVHVGLDDGSGDVVDDAIGAHAHALLDLGVRRPCDSGEEMFRAAVDLLGTHAEWGYEPAEVEGAWRRLAKRAHQGRDTIVISQPLLAAAGADQARSVVSHLAEFEVHTVVTVRAPDAWSVPHDPGRDLAVVLDRWAAAVRAPERVHVVVGDDPAATWRAFGRVAGFGTSSLKVAAAPDRAPLPVPAARAAGLRQLAHSWVELLAASPYDVVGDLGAVEPRIEPVDCPDLLVAAASRALEDARHEVERLSRRNEELERRLAKAEKKKRKLKRRLSEVA